ncbi:MAG: hypothetical protein ISS47_04520 [Candidatus Omnitrophica bacterium]|nr:hypothetical protein [Candidatus Omnitrophota bacterium]
MLYAIILAGGKGERFWPLSVIENSLDYFPI